MYNATTFINNNAYTLCNAKYLHTYSQIEVVNKYRNIKSVILGNQHDTIHDFIK